MPHDIAMINGKPAMAYVGQKPWHNLGTQFQTPPTTAGEVIKAAQLNWEVVKQPVYAFDGRTLSRVPGSYATYREDLWGKEGTKPFGLVGEEYQVLQNHEAFNFFDDVIEAGGVTYETAGALGQGERVWVLAKVKGPMIVGKVDEVERYLLLSNGHNGRTVLQIRFTPVRVVCQNTLNWALSKGSDLLRSHHGRGMDLRLEHAQQAVKEILGYYEDLNQHFNVLAQKPVAKNDLQDYLTTVFPEPKRRGNQTDRSLELAKARIRGMRKMGVQLFESGAGNDQPKIKNTMWTAYNAVTELVDHHLIYDDAWQRMTSLCFGEGGEIKQKAFDVALQLARN
jgi:phage/plasmid-like protein (TIGR03299 family)